MWFWQTFKNSQTDIFWSSCYVPLVSLQIFSGDTQVSNEDQPFNWAVQKKLPRINPKITLLTSPLFSQRLFCTCSHFPSGRMILIGNGIAIKVISDNNKTFCHSSYVELYQNVQSKWLAIFLIKNGIILTASYKSSKCILNNIL